MWQLFVFTRDASYEISSVWNCMSHKGCNLYSSFPLIFGTNFRYEPNYVQGHNNIEELVYDILQASISTRLGYISYVYITISRSLRYNVLQFGKMLLLIWYIVMWCIVWFVRILTTAFISDEDFKTDFVPARNPLPILRRFKHIFFACYISCKLKCCYVSRSCKYWSKKENCLNIYPINRIGFIL